MTATAARTPRARSRRAAWMKTLHQWHWISSALCLVGMILFSITGITLNHAGQIEGRPERTTVEAVLPSDLRAHLDASATAAALPDDVLQWLHEHLDLRLQDPPAEWSDDEIYLSLPRPGGDAWLSIDRHSGDVLYERTDRGWIAYLNDLHKGRNTGTAWSWFIDLFAVASLVFCLTGLVLLQLHARHRPMTWPVTGMGLVIPLLLALYFIH